MLKSKKILFVAIFACLSCVAISLQAQTNSPYSRYGLGSLRDQATGPSKGMGGVGYGLHTSQSANPMNPASYAQVDSLTFIFDIGVNYNYTTYKEGLNKSSKSNGGLDYVTVLFPVSKKLGISLGILPFSSTGYLHGSIKTAPNSTGEEFQYKVNHEGSGGLSLIYLGMGYKLPLKGLSAGFNVSYLFGNLKHTNAITAITGGADLTSMYSKLNVTTAKVDVGLQYQIGLKNLSSLTLGAVYSPRINGTGKLRREEYIVPSSSSSSSETNVVYDGSIATGTPQMIGAGFVYNHQRRLLLGADVKLEQWEDTEFSDEIADNLTKDNRFNNRWKFAVGAEYRIAEFSQSFFKKIKFRGGLNYSNSYINVKTADNQIKGYKEFGATLGLGLPIKDNQDLGNRTSYININFEYKYLQPEVSSMVKERFFGVSLNMNLNELWFLQRKIR